MKIIESQNLGKGVWKLTENLVRKNIFKTKN